MTTLLKLTALLSLLFSLGCGVVPYRIDVDQGNVVSETAVKKLTKGMSKQQVIGVLGRPLLKDPFHANRWDYVRHTIDGRTQARTKQTLTLTFVDNKLTTIVSK